MKMKKFLALAMSACMIFSMTTAVFAEGDGTEGNPEILAELTGDTVSIPGGTSEEGYNGYYYNYTVPAETEGIVQYNFSVTSATTGVEETTEYILNVDNLTTGVYGQIAPGYELYSAKVKASAGDVIQVKVMASADWSTGIGIYPAIDLTWEATSMSVGTEASPEVIETLNQYGSYEINGELIVIPNTDGYFYSYEAEANGTLSIYVDTNASVDTYDPDYPDMGEDDPKLVNSIDELKQEIIVSKENSSEVYKLSEDATQITAGYMQFSYDAVQIEVVAGDVITINFSSAATGYDDGVKMVFGATLEQPYGSEGNPANVYENGAEVEIPAGEKYFVSIDYSVAAYPFSITGGEAVAYTYEGEELSGLTGLTVTETYIGWDTYYFIQLENPTEEDVTYTFSFELPEGIYENPEVLDTNDTDSQLFEAGNVDAYFYTWTAPADGIVMFTVDSNAEWMYSVTNDTAGIYSDAVYSLQEDIIHTAMDVNEGDILSIAVYAVDWDMWTVDVDTTVETKVEFVESVGTVINPESVTGIIGDEWEGTGLLGGEYDDAGEIVLDMEELGGASVVPSELLSALKEYNDILVENDEEPIALIVEMDGYKWSISNVENATPVDLGITFDTDNTDEDVIEEVADGDDYITFAIAHTGDFGFDAELEFKVDVEYAGKTVTLYWDNAGTLVAQGTCTVAADGTVKLTFDHASDYVLVVEGTAVEEETTTVVEEETTTSGEEETTTVGEKETTTAGENETETKESDKDASDTGDTAMVGLFLIIAVVASLVVLTRKKVVEE